MSERTHITAARRERGFLVAADLPRMLVPVGESVRELARLADTAGLEVVGEAVQTVRRINAASFIGHGKVEEVRGRAEDARADVVIFDEPLSPAQQRNLERELNRKVIDRSALILDIFAQRARSLEGKMQVELAQLQYLLPRLTRQWTHLSRLGGGAPSATTSALLKTWMVLRSPAPISSRTLSTTWTCSGHVLCETSTTCSRRSAARTSSSVLLNASTSWWGSL